MFDHPTEQDRALQKGPARQQKGVGISIACEHSHERTPTFTAWHAVDRYGQKRGRFYASRVEALRRSPASGGVVAIDAVALLEGPRIPWSVVDLVFADECQQGIEVVLSRAVRADNWKLVRRAWWALMARSRDRM